MSPQVVAEVTASTGVVRPIFEPGDAILFDEMNLHSTAADPSMPNPRYAIESWFFGLSRLPRRVRPDRLLDRRPPMDFDLSPRVIELRDRIRAFMDEHVYPNEAEALRALDEEVTVDSGLAYPEILVEIRERARSEGLWNLFMPDDEHGAGLTNWEYGVLCEEMGRSPAIAPMAFNCSAPDTGNMEILAEHGTPEQKERSGSSRCSTARSAPAFR